MSISKAIESIEEEIASLKDQTSREVKDIYAYLSRNNAKTKLRPRIKMNGASETFSIIWQRLIFYNFNTSRAILKAIRKGLSYQFPKSRLLAYCRNCESWEYEYIWEKELEFTRIRRKVAFLSRALMKLKQYYAIEEAQAPEKCRQDSVPMTVEDAVKTMEVTFEGLKNRTVQEVSEISTHLAENGQTGIRPRIEILKSGLFSVNWFRQNGCDSDNGEPIERQISREGKYSIRRTRLLVHCRDCEEQEQEFVWEKELEFSRVRKQVDFLHQAITALRQYGKEAD